MTYGKKRNWNISLKKACHSRQWLIQQHAYKLEVVQYSTIQYSTIMLLGMWWKTAVGATTFQLKLNHSCVVDIFLIQWRQQGLRRESCWWGKASFIYWQLFFLYKGAHVTSVSPGPWSYHQKPLAAFKDPFWCQMSRLPKQAYTMRNRVSSHRKSLIIFYKYVFFTGNSSCWFQSALFLL